MKTETIKYKIKMIARELMENEVTHHHGGNCFVICEVLDDEYVRVTSKILHSFGSRAYLAAVSMLEVSAVHPEIPKDTMLKLTALREKLSDGSLKIVSTRIVKA